MIVIDECKYCIQNKDGIVRPLAEGKIRYNWQRISMLIKNNHIEFKMYQDFADMVTAEFEFPIKYCPMCGRKLKEVE